MWMSNHQLPRNEKYPTEDSCMRNFIAGSRNPVPNSVIAAKRRIPLPQVA